MAINPSIPSIGGFPPGILGPGLDINQVLIGLQFLLQQQMKEKPKTNLAARYIRDSGAFTVKPLENAIKVADGKQGEADYWSALGYDA